MISNWRCKWKRIQRVTLYKNRKYQSYTHFSLSKDRSSKLRGENEGSELLFFEAFGGGMGSASYVNRLLIYSI